MSKGVKKDKTALRARLGKVFGGGFASAMIYLVALALIYALVINAISPKRHDLKAGDIAPQTITATKDIEDEIATEQLREAAVDRVERAFRQDDGVTNDVIAAVETDIAAFTAMRQEFMEYKSRFSEYNTTVMPTPNMLQRLREAMPWLEEESDNNIRQWLLVDESAFLTVTKRLSETVVTGMEDGVREEQEASHISRIEQNLRQGIYSESNLLPIATAIIRQEVRANIFYDEETTQNERMAAEAAVQPVMLKKGQNIVVAGEKVTEANLHILARLGLLSTDEVDWELYVGIAIYVLALSQIIVLYVVMFEPHMLTSPLQILLLAVIILLALTLVFPLRLISPYLIPAQCGTLLIALLLRPRLAMVSNIVLAALVGLMATTNEGVMSTTVINILLINLICGTVTVFFSRKALLRSALVLSGFGIAAFNFVTAFGIGFMTITDFRSTLYTAAYAAGSGLLSTMLAVALMPLMEVIFNLVTPQKLLELSNPNHPLLRQLQIEASGTYHHSLLVANLAEAAAEAIGGNALMCRVGAYYHDIGKVKRPGFFIENQIMGENPHDQMDARMSTAIISAHPKDGAQMATKYKLPKPIIDIIQQHHGGTVLAFFYGKAVKAAESTGEIVDIEDFRYDGSHPDTKESAVVMLADSVEAAARSIKDPTREKVEALVRKLVKAKVDDGQLDKAPLTFADIERIIQAFMVVFSGIYHHRIEYPEVKPPQRHST